MGLFIVIDDERTFFSENARVEYYRDSFSGMGRLADVWTKGLVISQLWLDHDLGPNDDIMRIIDFLNKLGFLAKQQETYGGIHIDEIYVHTQNPVGGENMVRALDRFYWVKRVPLPVLV